MHYINLANIKTASKDIGYIERNYQQKDLSPASMSPCMHDDVTVADECKQSITMSNTREQEL